MACCAACAGNTNCFRWTWSPTDQLCYLKHDQGWIRKLAPGKTSGRVFRPPSSAGPASSPTPPPAFVSDPYQYPPIIAPVTPGGPFTKQNYADVLALSWRFYEAQRSGVLPPNYRVPWRLSAHTSDVVPGGWYDAGDYLKLNFPLASTVSYLAWGILEFSDGYNAAQQMQPAMDNLFAAVDYLKRSHIAPRKYVGQIGHPDIDHNYWGRADQEHTARPAFVYSGSMGAADLYGKVAAALASCSLVWRGVNASYAADLLAHATDMYSWAVSAPGLYSDHYKSATQSIYPSSAWEDDVAWAAYWMYRATGTGSYMTDAVHYWKKQNWDVTTDWDNSGAAVAVALSNLADDGTTVPSSAQVLDWTTNTLIKSWVESNGMLQQI